MALVVYNTLRKIASMPNNALFIEEDDTLWDNLQQYLQKSVWIVLKVTLLLMLLRSFVLEPGLVDGQSMHPTLKDAQRLLVNKVVYLLHTPERYDIIQFSNEEGQLYVKRVIGLPGELVIFKENTIFVQTPGGEEFPLAEHYLSDQIITKTPVGQVNEFLVPEDSYFLVGDNRMFSVDSRVYGPIHRRHIHGKVHHSIQ